MFSKKKPLLSLLVKGTISVALILYLFFEQLPNLHQIQSALLSANPYWILLAISLHGVGFLLCSLRWRLLLDAQNVHFSLGFLASSYLVGIFFNSFLPGTMSGDVVRALDTSDRVGSVPRSMLIVFVERLTGMIALLVLAGVALSISGLDVLGHPNIQFFLIFLSFSVLFAVLLLFHPLGFRVISAIVDQVPLGPVQRKFQQVADSLRVFSGKGRVLAACIFISLLFQINVVIHYWFIGEALGIEISWFLYFAYIPASLLLLMIPASINGIGLREQAFIFLFGNAGVTTAFAVSLAWIAFGVVLLQAVVGGIVFAIRKKAA